MAVKTITANLNVVPVGIENTKAKLQELLKSTNISPAIKLDIEKVLSKIDEIGPRIQGQLSSKGALNIDRMGFGKIDEAIFKIAKNIAKELGVAFDTTKVDEYAKKIEDVNSKINANQTKLNVNEKEMTKAKSSVTEVSQGLAPALRGEDANLKVKERILEIEKQMADTVNKNTKKYAKMREELKKHNEFLEKNKATFDKVTKLQEKEIALNKEKAVLSGELYNLTVAQEQATNQAISEIPEVVKANAAVKEYTDAKSQLIKATMDQAQANADAAQSELDVDNTQKKSKKSLLEKIFALFSFQKAMQFVNRVARDSVKTIKDLDKAITDMALVTTLSREEAWKLVGAMQNLATQTGLATSQNF
jgi:chromosome segregation ATPase